MTVTRTVYGAPADSAGAAAAEAARAEAAEAAEQARALAAEATDASQAASAAAAAAAEATRAAAAEGGLIPLSQRGAANGVGTLDAGGRQPIGQSPTGLVRTASNGSDFADVDATRANLKVPTLRHAQCVATTNQALSGALPTIDAYAVQDGDRVLLTGQSTGSQNGMWIAHTAGWARPSDYPASGVLTSRSCKVTGGTVYAGTDWYLASTASITVDTSSVTWKPVNVTAAQLPSSVVNASPSGGVIAWSTGLVIPLNQLVSNGGSTYLCKTAHTAGVSFDATKFDAIGSGGGGGVTTFNTRSGAVTLAKSDVTGTGLAAADVGAAPLASPIFTGTPAAPTPAVADASTALATTAYLAKVSPGPAYNLLPGNFWHWRRVVANVRAGLGSGKVLIVGDSTAWGKLETGTNPPFNASWPSRLAAMLNSYHVPAGIGLNAYGNPDPVDTRWTLGAGWTASSNNTAGFAGWCLNGASAAAGSLQFAPGYACDTVDIYWVRSGSLGTTLVTVDGGGTLATIATAGTASIQKTTVALGSLSSAHTLALSGPTGGQVFIVGIDAYDSTTSRVRVSLTGVSASVTGGTGQSGNKWLNSSAAYNSNGCITAYAPDLTIMMLGVNDANGSLSAANWNTATQSLITLAQASGDVLLVSVIPSSSASLTSGAAGVALEVAYGQQAALLAASNNCGYLDVNSRWGVYATANSFGFMADGEHPTNIGHADVAQAVFTALKLI